MNHLCALGLKYDTDKSPYWRGNTGHPYTPFYAELFMGKHVKRLMEIGVCTGASLRMWEEFFPEAEIYGLDVVPEVIANTTFATDRVKLKLCDASDQNWLRNVALEARGLFDVIIDDGSHKVEDQIAAANTLIPFLEWNGHYIIEDVQQGTEQEVSLGINYPTRVMELNSPFAPHRSDDRVIVAWRKL